MSVCPTEESEEAEVQETESLFICDGDDDGDETSVWSSEREAPSPLSLLCGPDLDDWSSVGDMLSDASDDGQDSLTSHESLSIQEHVPAAESSDEAQVRDRPATDSASSGRRKSLLTRMRRLFRRVTASLCCCRRPTVDD